jgi:hypothetical protein
MNWACAQASGVAEAVPLPPRSDTRSNRVLGLTGFTYCLAIEVLILVYWTFDRSYLWPLSMLRKKRRFVRDAKILRFPFCTLIGSGPKGNAQNVPAGPEGYGSGIPRSVDCRTMSFGSSRIDLGRLRDLR